MELTMLCDDGIRVVNAQESDTPGLVYFQDDDTRWVVAHYQSGTLIGDFANERGATLACRFLGELEADWLDGIESLARQHGRKLAANILLALALAASEASL